MARFRLLAVAAVAATTLAGLVPATAHAAEQDGQGDNPGYGRYVDPGQGGGTAEGLLCQIFRIHCGNQ